jgi:Na+/H+-translocating membrane pyrophosphatase
MPTWKVLLIGLLFCACLALSLATILVPLSHEGSSRWLWLSGLLAATVLAGLLLATFLRHAGGSLDSKTRGTRF